jgi:DNA-formamidopyrimidine glycosylase
MPEGPEVRTIVDGLENELHGAKLEKIIFSEGGKYRDKVPPHFREFEEQLPMKIKGVKCQGKFIYFGFQKVKDLSDKSEKGGEKKNYYMGNSLGMTGVWEMSNFDDKSSISPKHLCMTLVTDRGLFEFIDQRHFGCVHFYMNREELKAKLSTIGPDFLNSEISESKFIELYRKKGKRNIVTALMDQKLVSGVGNYIKSEALYRAKISPHRTIGELSDEELGKLYQAIRKVSRSSYKHGGMSQENYVDLDGKQGEYVNYLQVYRRKKDPKGRKVVREETKDKRSTFWVPDVQV